MQVSKSFRIVILEDNEFYNRLLTKQLQNYTDIIAAQKGYAFSLETYTSSVDCLANLKDDTDIAFIDFYLGNSVTGLDIMKRIKEKCENCKIIIISQSRNAKTAYETLSEGAYDFIFKDGNALAKSCFLLEDVINAKEEAK